MQSEKNTVVMQPIGWVHTNARQVPRHWSVSSIGGILEIVPHFAAGLKGIVPGGLITVLFWFHQSVPFEEELLWQQPPHLGNESRGVFATCSPRRPNPLGMSVVSVVAVQANQLQVKGLDMLDGTPILDIKPYIAAKADKDSSLQ